MDAAAHSRLMVNLEDNSEFKLWFGKGRNSYSIMGDVDLKFASVAKRPVPSSTAYDPKYAGFKNGWIIAKQLAEGAL